MQQLLQSKLCIETSSNSSHFGTSVWSLAPAPFRALFPPRPVASPSLPPSSSGHYTVILDLDETLLHTEWIKGEPERCIVHERPFVREFLRSLKKLPFEVIIFTAGVQGYADAVIDIMDRETRSISHRLYRQHTTNWGLHRWKDLSLINRDLDRSLIVDNSPDVFRYHPNNGIEISPWEGHRPAFGVGSSKQFQNVDDFALINLLFWLEHMAGHRCIVPYFIQRYRESMSLALGRSSRINAMSNYIPPFELGEVSLDLLQRCLPDSPVLMKLKSQSLNSCLNQILNESSNPPNATSPRERVSTDRKSETLLENIKIRSIRSDQTTELEPRRTLSSVTPFQEYVCRVESFSETQMKDRPTLTTYSLRSDHKTTSSWR